MGPMLRITIGMLLAGLVLLLDVTPAVAQEGAGVLSAAMEKAAAQATATQPRRHHDSVLNGVLIGAGIGALVGLVPDYYDDCEECHDSLYISTAVGAGIGLLIDALRMTPATAPSIANRPFDMRFSTGRRKDSRFWFLGSRLRF